MMSRAAAEQTRNINGITRDGGLRGLQRKLIMSRFIKRRMPGCRRRIDERQLRFLGVHK